LAEKKTRVRSAARTVQRFWTELMVNESADMKDRLKASEFLAKSFELFDKKGEETQPESDVSVTVQYKESGE